MSTPNIYDLGDLVSLTGRFYSDPALTTPADPTTVTLSLRGPSRVVTTPAPTKTSTGVYTYSWTPTAAGLWEINWTGTGAVVSADQEAVYVKVGIDLGKLYLPLDQLKATLSMGGTTFADIDLSLAISAASRTVDSLTERRFWLDADANQVRYYTPTNERMVRIDDLVTLTSVQVDLAGGGTYSDAWTLGTDFVLEPFNAPAEFPPRPFETLRVRMLTGRWFPTYIEQSIKVTGRFGWPSVPDDVVAATGILASKLLRRSREAPFGIVTAGTDQGVAMRIARTDPDVDMLLRDYYRSEYV